MSNTNDSGESSKISYLDGPRFHRALIAGIQQVLANQDYLNKINVFPVPDSDTGTNMAMTLGAILEATAEKEYSSFKQLLEEVADASLDGARGNSGAILAQFFQGMSQAAENFSEQVDCKQFVATIVSGKQFAYEALSEPKEGTILSTIAAMADTLEQQITSDNYDFIDLLKHAVDAAETALANTPNQLKVLKKAGVVDAGAQGFVNMLNGIYTFIHHGTIRDLQKTIIQESTEKPAEYMKTHLESKYRFCTECLIIGRDIDHKKLKAELKELGDCLIVAGSPKKAKIHIHSNEPAKIFSTCQTYGELRNEKADDMIQQQLSMTHHQHNIAILVDSGADIPESITEELDIHFVPLLLHFGNEHFIDKVSITPTQFYKKLAKSATPPTTSQPSFGEFRRHYQYLKSHYKKIIAIHISGDISGTLTGSQKAAKNISNNITVLDSLNVTVALGLIAIYAAEAAKAGLSNDVIVGKTQEIIQKTKLYAAIPDLSYTVRGGRISPFKKVITDLLHLTPVISLNKNGTIHAANMLFGKKNLVKNMFKLAKKKIDSNKTYRVAVAHSDCQEKGKALLEMLKNNLPNIEKTRCYLVDCGPVLGAHVGPGALAFALQEYTPPQ